MKESSLIKIARSKRNMFFQSLVLVRVGDCCYDPPSRESMCIETKNVCMFMWAGHWYHGTLKFLKINVLKSAKIDMLPFLQFNGPLM